MMNDLLFEIPIIPNIEPPTIEFRVYYKTDGSIITYTTENIPGNYIVITPLQYAEARPDALVIDGQLTYTHTVSHVSKLEKNKTSGVKTSKYDISVISSDGHYYIMKSYAIKR